MRKVLLFVSMLCVGCSIPLRESAEMVATYHSYRHDASGKVVPLDVTLGMTAAQCIELLGAPQSVISGRNRMRFDMAFGGFRPGSLTDELAWDRSTHILVAYFDFNAVKAIGIVGNR